jgi:hypothetical protein
MREMLKRIYLKRNIENNDFQCVGKSVEKIANIGMLRKQESRYQQKSYILLIESSLFFHTKKCSIIHFICILWH